MRFLFFILLSTSISALPASSAPSTSNPTTFKKFVQAEDATPANVSSPKKYLSSQDANVVNALKIANGNKKMDAARASSGTTGFTNSNYDEW